MIDLEGLEEIRRAASAVSAEMDPKSDVCILDWGDGHLTRVPMLAAMLHGAGPLAYFAKIGLKHRQ